MQQQSKLRYDVREDMDGTWSVIDVNTNDPVVVNDTMLEGLVDVDDADDLVDILNKIDQDKRAAKEQ